MNLNPHLQRVLTSLLLLPLLGWAILTGGVVLEAVVAIAACLGLWEFFSMFWERDDHLLWKLAGLLGCIGIIWAPQTWSLGALSGLSFFAAATVFLFTYARGKEDAFQDSQILLFGLLYLPLALRLVRGLSPLEILFVLIGTFATDTGAFYAGCYFGKKKIWPAISPKKTWIGSIGGFVLCVLLCSLYGAWRGNASIISFAALAALMNIAAQLGDFFESALKRWRNIKDSGKLLPGHGGILDRIDSLLFVLPLYVGLNDIFHFFG